MRFLCGQGQACGKAQGDGRAGEQEHGHGGGLNQGALLLSTVRDIGGDVGGEEEESGSSNAWQERREGAMGGSFQGGEKAADASVGQEGREAEEEVSRNYVVTVLVRREDDAFPRKFAQPLLIPEDVFADQKRLVEAYLVPMVLASKMYQDAKRAELAAEPQEE